MSQPAVADPNSDLNQVNNTRRVLININGFLEGTTIEGSDALELAECLNFVGGLIRQTEDFISELSKPKAVEEAPKDAVSNG